MSQDRIDMETLHERLQGYKTAMLVTVSRKGAIHARPMATQEREPDADLFFVSALNTEKIDEIRANPKVGVLYYRDADNAYVSLSGTAHIDTDRARIRAMWKEDWKVWFPEGPDQENLCLIKVDVEEAEYWEPQGGKLRVIFDMARAYATGETPDINPPVEGRLE